MPGSRATNFGPGNTLENAEANWQNVDAPVLVVRASKDTVMSRADSSAIADIVNRVHPGRARYVEVDEMSHGFTRVKKFYAEVVSIVLDWAKEKSAGAY